MNKEQGKVRAGRGKARSCRCRTLGAAQKDARTESLSLVRPNRIKINLSVCEMIKRAHALPLRPLSAHEFAFLNNIKGRAPSQMLRGFRRREMSWEFLFPPARINNSSLPNDWCQMRNASLTPALCIKKPHRIRPSLIWFRFAHSQRIISSFRPKQSVLNFK